MSYPVRCSCSFHCQHFIFVYFDGLTIGAYAVSMFRFLLFFVLPLVHRHPSSIPLDFHPCSPTRPPLPFYRSNYIRQFYCSLLYTDCTNWQCTLFLLKIKTAFIVRPLDNSKRYSLSSYKSIGII